MEDIALAVDVVMPRLGWTMETGKVAEWLKKDGDTVQAGDVIFTVESDKALQEVEALESGILRVPSASAPGVEVPVGAVLAYLVQPGEAAPFDLQPDVERAAPRPSSAAQGVVEAAPAAMSVMQAAPTPRSDHANHATPSISPRARRVAA